MDAKILPFRPKGEPSGPILVMAFRMPRNSDKSCECCGDEECPTPIEWTRLDGFYEFLGRLWNRFLNIGTGR